VKQNSTASSWLAIYSSQGSAQDCIGHALSRGKTGWEAFGRDDQSVGLFPSLTTAADALERLANEARP
jgi:hypothetical protein